MANEIKNRSASEDLTKKTTELMAIVSDKLDYLSGDGAEEFSKFIDEQTCKEDEGDMTILAMIYSALMAGKFLAPDLYKELVDLAKEATDQTGESA